MIHSSIKYHSTQYITHTNNVLLVSELSQDSWLKWSHTWNNTTIMKAPKMLMPQYIYIILIIDLYIKVHVYV